MRRLGGNPTSMFTVVDQVNFSLHILHIRQIMHKYHTVYILHILHILHIEV